MKYFEFVLGSDAKLLFKFMNELPKRINAANDMVTYEAARILAERVSHYAPSGGQFEGYGDSITVKRIAKETSAYIVTSDADMLETITEQTVNQTVISFTSEARPLSVIEQILVDYSPWPAGLVPFRPTENLKATSRHVTAREIDILNDRIKSEWKSIADIVLNGTDIDFPTTPIGYVGQSAVKDFAFQVLRAEFGIGEALKPHWRPAVDDLFDARPKLLKRIERTLTDPTYGGWRFKIDVDEIQLDSTVKLQYFEKKVL